MTECPVCGNDDLSYDGPGWMADVDESNDPPLICERCLWRSVDWTIRGADG